MEPTNTTSQQEQQNRTKIIYHASIEDSMTQTAQQIINEKKEAKYTKIEDQFIDIQEILLSLIPIDLDANVGLQKYIVQRGTPLYPSQNQEQSQNNDINQQNDDQDFEKIPVLSSVYFKQEIRNKEGQLINQSTRKREYKLVLFEEKSTMISGLHYILRSMNKGEICWARIPIHYHKNIHDDQNILPNVPEELYYKIELFDIKVKKSQCIINVQKNLEKTALIQEQQKNITFDDKISHAEENSNKAREWFQKKEFQNAIKYYQKAVSILSQFPNKVKKTMTEENFQQVKVLKIKYFNNKCVCHIKLEDYPSAINTGKQVLEEDQENFKANFNIGKSHYQLKNLNQALDHIKICTDLDKTHKESQTLYSTISNEKKQFVQSEKQKQNKGFFNNNTWENEKKQEKLKMKQKELEKQKRIEQEAKDKNQSVNEILDKLAKGWNFNIDEMENKNSDFNKIYNNVQQQK